MTGKSFLIFCLLVTAAFSQFNLTGFLLNSKTKTPTVPPAPATSSSTSSSSTTTTPKSTSSPPPSSEGDTGAFAPQDSYVPCGSRESCGQARSFGSKQDFQNFLDKSLPPQPKPSIPTAPAPVPEPTPIAVPASRPIQTIPQPEFNNFYALQNNNQQLRVQDLQSGSQSNSAKMSIPIAQQASIQKLAPIAPQAYRSASIVQPSSQGSSIGAAIRAGPPPPVNPANEFSTTNNQVDNVDEADLLKTDGTYIYTVSNQIFSIILAYPSNKAKVVSKMWFNDFNASALFLEGDYVAVFGTMWNYYSNSVDYTFIKILDVSNRANPFWVREFKVAGKYFDGRKLSNGFMYLVTNYELTRSYQPIPWFDAGTGRIDLDFSSIFWYPSFVYIRPSAINILSFNLANPIGSRKKVVTICSESAGVMYMSERYIYLAINTTLNGVAYTQLRKIFVWGNYIIPFADGLVVGTIKNQFSLDEYSFFLRIATTDWSANNVFVLDYFLQPYGKLTNIAPNQRIESCRFVGKRLYLVTFRTEDPFFVISFSNHRLPKILGQLHISGVSTYLHPYDETTMIGIGRSTDSTTARRLGLKIELFDVSNVASPKSNFLFQINETYASSTAEWEHKAFLFSADKNLLVIPGQMNSSAVAFNGAFAFYITKDEVTLKSAIDHLLNPSDNYDLRKVERSLWINQLLYTKSKCLLRINQISDTFDLVKSVNIPCDQSEFDGPVVGSFSTDISNSYVPTIPPYEPIKLPKLLDPVPYYPPYVVNPRDTLRGVLAH